MESNISNRGLVTFEISDKRIVVGCQIADCVCGDLGQRKAVIEGEKGVHGNIPFCFVLA